MNGTIISLLYSECWTPGPYFLFYFQALVQSLPFHQLLEGLPKKSAMLTKIKKKKSGRVNGIKKMETNEEKIKEGVLKRRER